MIDITAEDPYVVARDEMHRNPYPHYDRIRQKGNLVWSSAYDEHWLTATYSTAVSIFNDQRFGVEVSTKYLDAYNDIRHDIAYRDLFTGLTKFMLAQDPPAHTKIRKLANKAFTRNEVTGMTAKIEGIISDLLDRATRAGEMDLIADFAFPLPINIICSVLGLPSSDHQLLKNCTDKIALAVEPSTTKDTLAEPASAAKELFDYLREIISERRKNPGDDLITAFIQAEEEGHTLSLDEILANLLLLIIAGHETTVNLIGNGTLALLRNPQAMEKLRQQPELIPSAVEEFLRLESPLQITDRFAREDFEFEGQVLRTGQRVSILIGGANHDPGQFEDPHTLNVERNPNKHLAFGQGIHFCLGAPLARFEAKLAFEQLLSRLKDISLATDEPEYKPLLGFRGLSSLPIKFAAAART